MPNAIPAPTNKLDEGRVRVLRPLKHHDTPPTLIMIAEECLSHEDCDIILIEHKNTVESKVSVGDGNVITPHKKELLENHVPWKYDLNGTKITVIPQDTNAFNIITEIVDPFLPKNDDYGMITYMTIQEYPQGTFFGTHKDDADSNDSATVVFTLNEEFEGGQFHIKGHTIAQRKGSMVAFNNNTEIFHSVDPILRGTRFALCIWFCPFEELDNEDVQV